MNVQDQLSHYGMTVDEVLDLAGQISADRFKRDGHSAIESPNAATEMFEKFLSGRSEEIFAVAFLDTRHRLIKLEALFRGTIDAASVHPRVVAQRALEYGAAAVLVAHNHPSGIAKPSFADSFITARLKQALELLEIRLLDHFIVGDSCISSLKEMEEWEQQERKAESRRKAVATRKARAKAKLQAGLSSDLTTIVA